MSQTQNESSSHKQIVKKRLKKLTLEQKEQPRNKATTDGERRKYDEYKLTLMKKHAEDFEKFVKTSREAGMSKKSSSEVKLEV